MGLLYSSMIHLKIVVSYAGYHNISLSLVTLQRVEQERTLTDVQRDEFEDMLRALTLERVQIKEAMGFALDNADAAGEVMLLSYLWCFLALLVERHILL